MEGTHFLIPSIPYHLPCPLGLSVIQGQQWQQQEGLIEGIHVSSLVFRSKTPFVYRFKTLLSSSNTGFSDDTLVLC